MDDLIRKYSEELQKVQRERNQLKIKIVNLKDRIAVLECENSNLKRKLYKEGGKLYMTSTGEEYISEELERTIINNTIIVALDQIEQGESK